MRLKAGKQLTKARLVREHNKHKDVLKQKVNRCNEFSGGKIVNTNAHSGGKTYKQLIHDTPIHEQSQRRLLPVLTHL